MARERSDLTDPAYQASFLGKLSKAEAECKRIIMAGALWGTPIFVVKTRIKGICDRLEKELPKETIDRQSYILGILRSSDRMIRLYYGVIGSIHSIFSAAIVSKGMASANRVDTPMKLYSFASKASESAGKGMAEAAQAKDVWPARKGTPRISDYPAEIKRQLNGAAKFDFAPEQEGKRRISNWQKAEMDVRHRKQAEMVEGLKGQGKRYCWISTHPDCSKRCEKWQGKLVDLEGRSELSGFRMSKKIDGNTVYSLADIMAVKDEYGYENNIINGFNCRHHLIPYSKGTVPPEEFSAKELKDDREANERLRAFERAIRECKMKSDLNALVDKRAAAEWGLKAKRLTEAYKRFAEGNGFAWHPYRIAI